MPNRLIRAQVELRRADSTLDIIKEDSAEKRCLQGIISSLAYTLAYFSEEVSKTHNVEHKIQRALASHAKALHELAESRQNTQRE